MQCSGCGLKLSLDDNFCRRCGSATGIIDVPAVRGAARAPSIWQHARPVVARGVVLLAAGTVLRFAFARVVRALVSRPGTSAGPLARFASAGGNRLTRGSVEEFEMIRFRRVRR